MKNVLLIIAALVAVGETAQAGGSLRTNSSCSDILGEAYNRETFSVGSELVSLRACRGEQLTLVDRDNRACVVVNRCDRGVVAAPAPAPAPRETRPAGNYSAHNYVGNEIDRPSDYASRSLSCATSWGGREWCVDTATGQWWWDPNYVWPDAESMHRSSDAYNNSNNGGS